MKLQKDDARLLQYVLNEISAVDRQIVENSVGTQPEIAAEVQSLKALYLDIVDVESLPENLKLSALQKQELFQKTIYKQKTSSFGWHSEFKKWRYATGGLLAATFALMVFTHSLKDEVKEQAQFARPMIPADSAMSPAPTKEKLSKVADSPEVVTEHDLQATKGAQKESSTEDQAQARAIEKREEFESTTPAPQQIGAPAQLAEAGSAAESEKVEASFDEAPTAQAKAVAKMAPVESDSSQSMIANEVAISKNLINSKKTFLSSKQVSTLDNRARSVLEAQSLGASRSAKDKFAEVKSPSTAEFIILISSRALEAEQVRTLQTKAKDCLQQFPVSQELKIAFDVHAEKFEFKNASVSASETRFTVCVQKFMASYLPKSIKFVHFELKNVSK